MSIRACRILTENVNYRLAAFIQGKQLNLDKESRVIAFLTCLFHTPFQLQGNIMHQQ